MEITLIKVNENTLEVNIEKIIDTINEYEDEQILFEGSNICIVCRHIDIATINEYKRALLKALLQGTKKELDIAYEELLNLNKRYIGLVNKLI